MSPEALGGGPNIPGFATGGSFKIGGSGGPDSKRIAFNATPGEIIDIKRPGQTPKVNVEAPQIHLKIVNIEDPETALSAMRSTEGEKTIMNTIKRNIRTIKRM